jgi:hypothetical protein
MQKASLNDPSAEELAWAIKWHTIENRSKRMLDALGAPLSNLKCAEHCLNWFLFFQFLFLVLLQPIPSSTINTNAKSTGTGKMQSWAGCHSTSILGTWGNPV